MGPAGSPGWQTWSSGLRDSSVPEAFPVLEADCGDGCPKGRTELGEGSDGAQVPGLNFTPPQTHPRPPLSPGGLCLSQGQSHSWAHPLLPRPTPGLGPPPRCSGVSLVPYRSHRPRSEAKNPHLSFSFLDGWPHTSCAAADDWSTQSSDLRPMVLG